VFDEMKKRAYHVEENLGISINQKKRKCHHRKTRTHWLRDSTSQPDGPWPPANVLRVPYFESFIVGVAIERSYKDL